MITQYPSCSYVYQEPQIEEWNQILEVPSSAGMDVFLSIIEEKISERYRYYGNECDMLKQSSSLSDIVCVDNYMKWKSQINVEFKSLIEVSLASFANKLNETNCGSFVEKKVFLSAISGRISSYYPFKMIGDSMISFIDSRIAKVVLQCAEKEIKKRIRNYHSINYDVIAETILKKSEKNVLKKFNKLELAGFISRELSASCGEKYIEEELRGYFDTEAMPFAVFVDIYRDHLEENCEIIMSKSIEILDNILKSRECFMSFAFSLFFGNMMLSSDIKKLCSIINFAKYDLRSALMNSIPTRANFGNGNNEAETDPYHDKLRRPATIRRTFSRSRKRIKKEVERYLIENCVVVIKEGIISICCEKEFVKRIVEASINSLDREIKSYI